jgi:hypothetical protein
MGAAFRGFRPDPGAPGLVATFQGSRSAGIFGHTRPPGSAAKTLTFGSIVATMCALRRAAQDLPGV